MNLVEGIIFDDIVDDTNEIENIKKNSNYRNHQRVGETITNKYGTNFEIIEYNEQYL